MTTKTLKKELHKAIDITEDANLLEAVYTILNRKPALYDFELTKEQQDLIDTRQKQFKEGKLKTISLQQIKTKALQRLKK